MCISEFRDLSEHQQNQVLRLVLQPHNTIRVLDQWQDDHLECVLVRADPPGEPSGIRFVVYHTSYETAAAFRFHDSVRARRLILDYLDYEISMSRIFRGEGR